MAGSPLRRGVVYRGVRRYPDDIKRDMEQVFKSRREFKRFFDSDEKCIDCLVALRWPKGPFCPFCLGSTAPKATQLPGRNGTAECQKCHKSFNVWDGTIFDDPLMPIHKWFWAVHIMDALVGQLYRPERLISELDLDEWVAPAVLRKLHAKSRGSTPWSVLMELFEGYAETQRRAALGL